VSVDAAAIMLAKHEQLPPRAAAAARVLQLVDDPDAAALDVARAMGTDPVFAARVLRVANSTYYGLSGRVSTLPFAVSVIGFQAVRSLAVVAAAGLDDPAGAPAGFWQVAALSATAAELVAPLISADPGDSFALGLLHTIGAALLHQHQALPAMCLPEGDEIEELLRVERERYGVTHDQLGARVLSLWHFPAHICALIARHHDQILPDATPLERALHAARLMTDHHLRGRDGSTLHESQLQWLTDGRLGHAELPGLMERMADRSSALLDGLQPRR
jgi:HD-like signal output (HDOD) protein